MKNAGRQGRKPRMVRQKHTPEIGIKINKLYIVAGGKLLKNKSKNGPYETYICVCDCEMKSKEISAAQLRKGIMSCGCETYLSNKGDLIKTGEKYTRLEVIDYVKIKNDLMDNDSKYMWEFLCDCGNTFYTISKGVRRGGVQSCGCLNSENAHKKAIVLINKKTFHDQIGLIERQTYEARYADGDITLNEYKIFSQASCFYCDILRTNERIKKL